MKILILIVAVFLTACECQEHDQARKDAKLTGISDIYRIIPFKHKDHEYLYFEASTGGGGIAVVHNPDCKGVGCQ